MVRFLGRQVTGGQWRGKGRVPTCRLGVGLRSSESYLSKTQRSPGVLTLFKSKNIYFVVKKQTNPIFIK